jgi:hypothetical protein
MGAPDGFVKMIADAKTDEPRRAHDRRECVGPDREAVVAMEFKAASKTSPASAIRTRRCRK